MLTTKTVVETTKHTAWSIDQKMAMLRIGRASCDGWIWWWWWWWWWSSSSSSSSSWQWWRHEITRPQSTPGFFRLRPPLAPLAPSGTLSFGIFVGDTSDPGPFIEHSKWENLTFLVCNFRHYLVVVQQIPRLVTEMGLICHWVACVERFELLDLQWHGWRRDFPCNPSCWCLWCSHVRWLICKSKTGWWFQIFLIFTLIWEGFPFWLIFFKGVETTN